MSRQSVHSICLREGGQISSRAVVVAEAKCGARPRGATSRTLYRSHRGR